MDDQLAMLMPEIFVRTVKVLDVVLAVWLALVALRLFCRSCWP